MAVAFLQEARQRLPGKCDEVFDTAAAQYTAVCQRLRETLALHPFRPEAWDNEAKAESAQAAALLRQAGEAELKGLASIQEIVGGLDETTI